MRTLIEGIKVTGTDPTTAKFEARRLLNIPSDRVIGYEIQTLAPRTYYIVVEYWRAGENA